ncbi:hypothetical protein U9M48_015508 [Paspalum notatum var. saurae]|uniref:Uncharacterized protein n=1 Tax=Paspalum notatum var. saurae TaxID=547442 RepID=A0AAQ3WM48_PASNO
MRVGGGCGPFPSRAPGSWRGARASWLGPNHSRSPLSWPEKKKRGGEQGERIRGYIEREEKARLCVCERDRGRGAAAAGGGGSGAADRRRS